jgi:hypothetical protein
MSKTILRAGLGLVALALLIGYVPAASAQKVTRVKVESVEPTKTKYPTLRFLRENREFIRARLDLLRQSGGGQGTSAESIDPRFLGYQEIMNGILAAEDSVAAAEDARQRRALLNSITEISSLEEQLDVMDSLLAAQKDRLTILQEDFTGNQATALIVLLSGFSSSTGLNEIAVRVEQGITVRVPVTAELQKSLKGGGIAQIYHGFLEPRDQVIEVAVKGRPWPAGKSGFVTLVPARNRLTFLKLDMSSLNATGPSSLSATTWLHEDGKFSSNR